MSETVVIAAPTDEEINRFFAAKWKIAVCEICQTASWSTNPSNARFCMLPASDGTSPTTITANVYPCLPAFCNSCGNTKILALGIIRNWLTNNPEGG